MVHKAKAIASIVAIVLCVGARHGFSYPWPVSGDHPVTGTLGEWRAGHLHAGVDVARIAGTSVTAVAAGTIPGGGLGSDFVTVGNFDYVHIVRNPALLVGQQIGVGDFLGTIAGGSAPHVHLEESDGSANPLRPAGLDNFSDTARTYVYTLEFFQQGTETQLSDRIYRKVDILSQAKDSQSNGSSTVSVYRIGYQVQNHASTIVLGPQYNLVFDSVSGGALGLVYANFGSRQSSLSTYYYWTTNTMSENRYWNTQLRTGQQWDGADARINAEAAYPDGEYSVSTLAFDIIGNGGNLAQQQGALTGQTQIDNFRPFLTRATIGNEVKYDKQWALGETTLNCHGPSINQPLGDGTYTVTLEFSEPIQNPTLAIDTLGSRPLSSNDPAGQQKTFTTTFEVGGESPIQDGQRTMTITAADPAGNSLLAIAPGVTSINPATQLTRDAAGIMQGVGGADTSIGLSIAYPHFLVENQKFIFSEAGRKITENWA